MEATRPAKPSTAPSTPVQQILDTVAPGLTPSTLKCHSSPALTPGTTPQVNERAHGLSLAQLPDFILQTPSNLNANTPAFHAATTIRSSTGEVDEGWWRAINCLLMKLQERGAQHVQASYSLSSPAREFALLTQQLALNADSKVVYEEITEALKDRGEAFETYNELVTVTVRRLDLERVAWLDARYNLKAIQETDALWLHRLDVLSDNAAASTRTANHRSIDKEQKKEERAANVAQQKEEIRQQKEEIEHPRWVLDRTELWFRNQNANMKHWEIQREKWEYLEESAE